MSVRACTGSARATSAASLFRVDICATAIASCAAEAFPSRIALSKTPVPSGFVSRMASPGTARPLLSTASGCTSPVTQRPYLGSRSMIVCPPATAPPASRTLLAPPSSTATIVSTGRSLGNAAMLRAKSTSAPMA